jgi:integrase
MTTDTITTPKSTRGVVSGYGKGRTRRWRWTARVWRPGAAQSEQIRRQGFASEADAADDMGRVLDAVRAGKSTTVTAEPEVLTLGAALDRLLVEKARKRTIGEYHKIAKALRSAFGADTPLSAITAARISQYRADRLSKPSERTGKLLTSAGVNRPLAVLRHLLKRAHEEWGVLAAAPRVRLEREDQGRLRWLTHEEATRLLEATSKSRNPGLHDLVILSLGTGVRRSEAFGLTWDRVDRARGVIRLEVTKSGKRREVPFDADVDAMFARRARPSGKVFASGNWNSYRSAFETCVAHAKLDDFRWHDLRHTYASWAVQQGRPINEVKELLGHATLAMTMRYAHLAPEQGRQAAAAVGAVLSKALAARSTTTAPAPTSEALKSA